MNKACSSWWVVQCVRCWCVLGCWREVARSVEEVFECPWLVASAAFVDAWYIVNRNAAVLVWCRLASHPALNNTVSSLICREVRREQRFTAKRCLESRPCARNAGSSLGRHDPWQSMIVLKCCSGVSGLLIVHVCNQRSR